MFFMNSLLNGNPTDELFRRRKERLLKENTKALAGKKSFYDKVCSLKEILDAKGYLTDLEVNKNHYKLKKFNCLIYEVALVFKEACMCELQMYRYLFSNRVVREHCMAEGSNSCTYVIPRA